MSLPAGSVVSTVSEITFGSFDGTASFCCVVGTCVTTTRHSPAHTVIGRVL